jgi:hypothetical protein
MSDLSQHQSPGPVHGPAMPMVPVLSGIRDPEEIIQTILDFARNGSYMYPHLAPVHEAPLATAYGSLAARMLECGAEKMPTDEEGDQALLDLRHQVRIECNDRFRRDLNGVSVHAMGGHRNLAGMITNRIIERLDLKLCEIQSRRRAPRNVSARRRRAVAARRKSKSPLYSRIDAALCEIAKSHPGSHAQVFKALEGRVAVPGAAPFAGRGWVRGFECGKPKAHAWLAKRWALLGLPSFVKGPKQLQ